MFRKAIIIAIVTVSASIFSATAASAQGNPGSMTGSLLGVPYGNTPATPSQQTAQSNSGRYKLGQALSADAMRFLNYGSRYLLRVSTPYADPFGSGCSVELRAWVAQVEASDGSVITVKTGPVTPVRMCSGTPTVAQINQAEANMQNSRLWIAELQRNPGKYTNAQGWINAYTQAIQSGQQYVAQGAPR